MDWIQYSVAAVAAVAWAALYVQQRRDVRRKARVISLLKQVCHKRDKQQRKLRAACAAKDQALDHLEERLAVVDPSALLRGNRWQ